jgi:hypothetical protein
MMVKMLVEAMVMVEIGKKYAKYISVYIMVKSVETIKYSLSCMI